MIEVAQQCIDLPPSAIRTKNTASKDGYPAGRLGLAGFSLSDPRARLYDRRAFGGGTASQRNPGEMK
jgi:hypothetical protein